jgi:hypothetical protein
MSKSERPFEVLPDQFYHVLITKLGPLFVTFLYSLYRISVKDPITHLPTIELYKDPFDIGTERYRKRIVDSMFELYSKAEGEADYIKTALQIEHQHRNQAELNYRMFDYLHPMAQHYKGYEVAQILVYTGDEPFNSPTQVKFRETDYRFRVVDLTHDFLKEILNFPHFGIQFLCIFNHDMPHEEKVRLIVEGIHAFYQQHGREATQLFIDLLPLAMTKHNVPTIDAINAELNQNKEFAEMIKQTPYYKNGYAEGDEKGEKRGRKEGRVETTVEFIRNGFASLEALIDKLHLTAEEIAAIEAKLQQSSNGNGKQA